MHFWMTCLAIVVQFLGIATAAAHRDVRDAANNGGNEDVCTTQACNDVNTRLKIDMDITKNPCNDFYEFTCGGFLQRALPSGVVYENNMLAAANQYKSQLKDLFQADFEADDIRPVKLAKILYKTCMNEDTIEKKGVRPLKTLIDMLGGWPVLDGTSWKESHFDWLATTAAWTRNGHPQATFMQIDMENDKEDFSRRVLSIKPPSWMINSRQLKDGFDGNPVIRAYYTLMVDVAVSLGADRKKAEDELKEALQFHIALNNEITTSPRGTRRMTLKTLITRYPRVDWRDTFARMYSQTQTIGDDDVVVVYRPMFIQNVVALVARTPKRVLANFAIFQIIPSRMRTMNRVTIEKLDAYQSARDNYVISNPRWMSCVDFVKNGMPVSVTSMYVKQFLQPETKAKFVDMMNSVRQEFRANVDKVEIIDDATKTFAKKKAAAIKVVIGQPDKVLDNDGLVKYYEDLDLFDDYFFDSLRLMKFDYDEGVRKMREPINDVNSTDIFRKLLGSSPYTYPHLNTISFPANTLQRNSFNPDQPRYMDYATMGVTMGHEITHLFGTDGRYYDENGGHNDWFTQASERGFEEQSRCFQYQYGNYTEPTINRKVDGRLTLEENIADNAGVKRAYHAYVDTMSGQASEKRLPEFLQYSPKQMFWIIYSNVRCDKATPAFLGAWMNTSLHATSRSRITQTLSNSEEFAADFKCAPGSKMNPVQKCSIW